MARWFFSHAFVDQYAIRLVDQFGAGLQTHALAASKKTLAGKHLDRTDLAIRQMIAAARQFQKDEKLNLFQRARLAQQVQNRMISHGYPMDMSRELATALSEITSSTN